MPDGQPGVLGLAALQLAAQETKQGPEPALCRLIPLGVDHARMLQPWTLQTAPQLSNATVRASFLATAPKSCFHLKPTQ